LPQGKGREFPSTLLESGDVLGNVWNEFEDGSFLGLGAMFADSLSPGPAVLR